MHHTQLGASRARTAEAFALYSRRTLWASGWPVPAVSPGPVAGRAQGGGGGGGRFAPPRVRAPGAQMIRLASGSSLAFQRLSRRSVYWREREGTAPQQANAFCGAKTCTVGKLSGPAEPGRSEKEPLRRNAHKVEQRSNVVEGLRMRLVDTRDPTSGGFENVRLHKFERRIVGLGIHPPQDNRTRAVAHLLRLGDPLTGGLPTVMSTPTVYHAGLLWRPHRAASQRVWRGRRAFWPERKSMLSRRCNTQSTHSESSRPQPNIYQSTTIPCHYSTTNPSGVDASHWETSICDLINTGQWRHCGWLRTEHGLRAQDSARRRRRERRKMNRCAELERHPCRIREAPPRPPSRIREQPLLGILL
eukprot:gene5845-biopygen23783